MTLSYKVNKTQQNTESKSDFAKPKKLSLLDELTNSKDLIASEYSENNTTVDFNLLEPAVFTLHYL
jgi:hypothetical protein